MTSTPDDEERDAVEDVGYDWDEDDFDDEVADSRPEDDDEPPDDYTWPGEDTDDD